MHKTLPLLAHTDFPPLRRRGLETLQVDLGYRCNQSCLHCHVNAGPNRTETMSGELIDLVLAMLERRAVKSLDDTDGAPEGSGLALNLVYKPAGPQPAAAAARARGRHQMFGLPARLNGHERPHLRDLLAHAADGEAIRVADHCYGCTAGQSSSCGGALDTPSAPHSTGELS
jgi:hypothetical protein